MFSSNSMLGKSGSKGATQVSRPGAAPDVNASSHIPARLHGLPSQGAGQRGRQPVPDAASTRPVAPGRVLIGRAAETSRLSTALTLSQWRGAVVVGPGGIGKTALIQDAVGKLPATTPTRYLRGTALTQGTPYGILGLLLGRTAGRSAPTPSLADVLHTMTRNLSTAPSAGTPMVIVDNAEYADRWSALALSELARTGTILLILACRRVNDMAAEFSHLWRRGNVVRVDVPPLTSADARALICHELKGSCSLAAAALLWEKSAGNPLHLKALLRQAVEDGALALTDGFWVWREGRLRAAAPPGLGQLTRMLNAPQGNMAVLELVAVAETIPVATLASIHPIQDVDHFLRAADLAYAGNGKSSLRVAHPVVANVLPLLIAKERSLAMFAEVEAVDPLSQLHGSARDNRIRWGVDCGALAPNHPGAQGSTAAGTGLPQTGEGALPALTHRDPVTAEQSLEVGRQAQSLALAGRQDDALNLACSLTARMGLDGCNAPAVPALPWSPPLATSLLHTFTLCGEWKLVDALLAACQERGMGGGLRECAIFELTHGLVQAFRGNFELALPLLNQGHAQLKDAGMLEWAGMAQLNKLSATALLGQSQLAGTSPTLPRGAGPEVVPALTAVRDSKDIPALLFTLTQCLLAEATPPASRQSILELGAATDAPAQRLLVLGVQVDALATDACEELLLVAAAQEGALADVLSLYAKGVLAQDSTVLVQVVDSACTQDYPALSAKAARMALKLVPPVGARGIRRQLQRLVKLPEDLFDPTSVVNSGLTERERTVAMMAANGLSNRDIAVGMNISVRTVEGHLYQIYSKLHVSNRAELTPFLKEATA